MLPDSINQNRYRMILWLLRDHLADAEMREVISFSVQMLSGVLSDKRTPVDHIFMSYQQLLNEAQAQNERW